MKGKYKNPGVINFVKIVKKNQVEDAYKALNLPVEPLTCNEYRANVLIERIKRIVIHNKKIGKTQQKTLQDIYQLIDSKNIVSQLKKILVNPIQVTQEWEPIRQTLPFNSNYFTSVSNLNESPVCLCNNKFHKKDIRQCIDCQTLFHSECLQISNDELFQCPFCFSKNMDPLTQVKQVLFSGYIDFKNKVFHIPFVFEQSREKQQNIQIQMKCFRLNGKANYLISFPDWASFKLNEVDFCQFLPLAENSSLKRRNDSIKLIDKKLLKKNNILQIKQQMSYLKKNVRGYNHFIVICVVKRLTPEQLLSKIKTANSFEKVYHQTKPENNEDIQVQKIIFDLKCPYTLKTINIPVKGIQCEHQNCYDLETLISLNNKIEPCKRHWKCPLCSKKIHRLAINQMIYKIIIENQHRSLNSIILHSDGTFNLTEDNPEQLDSDNDQLTKTVIDVDEPFENQSIFRTNQSYSKNRENSLLQFGNKSSLLPKQDFSINSQSYLRAETKKNYKNISKQSLYFLNSSPFKLPLIQSLLQPQSNVNTIKDNLSIDLNTQQSSLFNPNQERSSKTNYNLPKASRFRKLKLQNKSFSLTCRAKKITSNCIIQIIDSDEETQQIKNTRKIQHQKHQLKLLLNNKDICKIKSTDTQRKIFSSVVQKLFKLY